MDRETQLGRLNEAERRAWSALEEARKRGASAEAMEQQRTNAASISDAARDLRAEVFHGNSRRR